MGDAHHNHALFGDGLLIGSWAVRIPAVQHQAELTDAKLGLALFAMSLGALASMPFAGWLCERIGSRFVTIAGLVGGAAALFLASLAGGFGVLAAALVAFGAGFGAINVSAKAQGLALERLYGRSILSSFHASFSETDGGRESRRPPNPDSAGRAHRVPAACASAC